MLHHVNVMTATTSLQRCARHFFPIIVITMTRHNIRQPTLFCKEILISCTKKSRKTKKELTHSDTKRKIPKLKLQTRALYLTVTTKDPVLNLVYEILVKQRLKIDDDDKDNEVDDNDVKFVALYR